MVMEFILIVFILGLIINNIGEVKNKKFIKRIVEYVFPYINHSTKWKYLGLVIHFLSLVFFTVIGYIILESKYNKWISIDIIIGTVGIFIIIVLIINFIISCVKLFIDYLSCVNNMKFIYVFFVPIIILLFGILGQGIKQYYELITALVSIIISLQIAYKEVIKIILIPNYIYGKGLKVGNKKIFKLKGIVVWFGIILLNLYSVLVFLYKYSPNFITLKDSTHQYFDLCYYLIITFTTIGYGDILPTSYFCKFISIIIALSGLLFTSIFIGTILSSDDNPNNDIDVI